MKVGGTAEDLASSLPVVYQRDDDRAAFVLFWLTGIAAGSVLGMVCVMLAYPGASGRAAPHLQPVMPPVPWPEGPRIPYGPEPALRNRDSGAPAVSAVSFATPSTKVSNSRTPQIPGFTEQHRAAAVMAKQEEEYKGFNHPVCYTVPCVWLARRLRDILNPLVHPCDDFNEHVCGRFDSSKDSIMDVYQGFVYEYTLSGVRSIGRSSLPPENARKKAANLAAGCFRRHSKELPQHDALLKFMKDERLSVETVPDRLDESYESLITLHVHLSFVYRLGGLFHITPTLPDEPMVLLDTSTVPRQAQFLRDLGPADSTTYLVALAAIAGLSKITLRQLQQAVDLNLVVHTALASSPDKSMPGYFKQPAEFQSINADQVFIRGLMPKFFGEALGAYTPYPTDTTVEFDRRLLLFLESLVSRFSKRDMYLWTSWTVLRELGPFVDSLVFQLHAQPDAYAACIRMVRHVMAVPLAASVFYVENTAQQYLEAMTRKLVHCFAQNISSLLSKLPDPYSDPPSMNVAIGYPPSEDTELKMNDKYRSYPSHKLGTSVFLTDWILAAKLRRQHLRPSDVSFDPFVMDVLVSRNGTVVVVPAAIVHFLFRNDAVAAFKHGVIGHMIARRFIQRLSNTTTWPYRYARRVGSKVINVPENLLAYECVADGFQLELELNSSAALWLPMHLHLTPWIQLFTLSCGIKDCRKRGLVTEGSCDTATLRRLPSFEKAFRCMLVRPPDV